MLRATIASACVLGGVLAAGPVRAADPPVAGERVRVERALLPVRIFPPDCPPTALVRVEVEEGGLPCRAVAFDAAPAPRVHALLIDNSATMAPLLAKLEQAVADYLQRIPPGDLALVATFADDLVLRAALSTDRAAQLDAVRDLPVGYRTALLDALHSTVRYLEPRSEPKVIVLFTDGADNSSITSGAGTALLEAARDVAGLTLFTILIDDGAGAQPASLELLRSIGESTGGALFEARGARAVGQAFAEIAERLSAEAGLSYEPPPFGTGEGEDGSTHRWREVVVRLPADSPCRVELPRARRLAGRAPVRAASEPLIEALDDEAALPAVLDDYCEVGHRCWRPIETLSFPPPAAWPGQAAEAPRFTLLSPPYYFSGRALDVVAEPGARYDETALAANRYLLRDDAPAVIEPREFVMALPDLEEVQASFHSAVDVLERWMLRGGGHASAFVQGQTWLELRPWLARAIYRSRTDYSRWADERLAAEWRRHAERLLAPYLAQASAEQQRRAREGLLEHRAAPGGAESPAVLAEWIADTPARDVALGLEARVADRMRELAAADRERERQRLEAFWPHLVQWFATPTRVRLVTPLFPLYDAARDVVGFERIVLPRPRPSGAPPLDPVPPHPFGMRVLLRLLGDRDFARDFAATAQVSGIGYRPVFLGGKRRGAPAAAENAGEATAAGAPAYSAFESTLRFATPEGPVALASILVRSPGEGFDLHCMELRSAPRAALAAWLERYVADSGLACAAGTAVLAVE